MSPNLVCIINLFFWIMSAMYIYDSPEKPVWVFLSRDEQCRVPKLFFVYYLFGFSLFAAGVTASSRGSISALWADTRTGRWESPWTGFASKVPACLLALVSFLILFSTSATAIREQYHVSALLLLSLADWMIIYIYLAPSPPDCDGKESGFFLKFHSFASHTMSTVPLRALPTTFSACAASVGHGW